MTIQTDLRLTSECLAIDRFGTALSDAEKAHVQGCARCEAELALWQEFSDSKPAPGEGAAVQWIVSEIHRRRAAQPGPVPAIATGWLSGLRLRPVMGLATAVGVAVLVVGYLLWDPEPQVGLPAPGEQIYRTASLDVAAPVGDIPTAPTELLWVAVKGAVRYDVQVLEIDRTVLWRGPSLASRVVLPGSVIEQIVPGKTMLWEVTAIDAAGASIATSGTQRFRVPVATP